MTTYPTVKNTSAQAGQLWLASYLGEVDMIERLLKAGVDIDEIHEGFTPLMIASLHGHAAVVAQLAAAGADLNIVTPEAGTALSQASYHGHREVISLLLAAGAQAELSNGKGETPL
jgi:ankyrin repeat protein